LNPPCCDGSKSTGVCAVRFTGAKYARTRRATGAGAENQLAVIAKSFEIQVSGIRFQVSKILSISKPQTDP
jgi:hypothetical protein